MKYIDADKLKAEIERRMLEDYNSDNEEMKYADEVAQGVCASLLFFIDSLQQEQQEEPDKDLEEAAEEYVKKYLPEGWIVRPAFIAGAQWQAEQDDRDVVFWKGMQYAIAGMKEDAVEGVIIDSGFDDGTAFVTMNIPDRRYDRGDKVKLIIIKDDGKSD